MCGIAGYIDLHNKPSSSHIIKMMTDSLIHRGPDGEGQWCEDNVAIGHRRLSIIDLSEAGSQPMLSPCHRYVLSYNGEIYNFKELRIELKALGFQFRSQTDSEVLLHALTAWGLDAITRLNGMFAFALWDRKEKQLHLARDRYGIKPLYFAKMGSTFTFASEQKAIQKHPSYVSKINKKALVEYFTFQNIFTDQTLIENIELLPAGSILTLSYSGDAHTNINVRKYWDYHFSEPLVKADPREYREELDRLIQQAVSRQLVTDVELGAYLSGGMDSGTLTALASKQMPYIKTFTCGFDLSSASGIEISFDERTKAEAMSALFKSEHYEMVLKAGDMERCLPDLAFHIEEPRVGQCYPNFYIAKLASKFVKVVLSGAGGDELFGGYPWRYYRATACDSFEDYINRYYDFWQRLIPDTQLKSVFAPVWSEVESVNTRDIFKSVFQTHQNNLETPEDYINHSLYFEAKTFLQGLFTIEDKLSMAHSLETRVPFMDNDLVDFAMRCPVDMKLNNLQEVSRINENDAGSKKNKYFKKTKDGKQILRDVMSKYIPEEITGAEKQGFSSPDASWFKGESIDFVKDTLIRKDSPLYDFMDKKVVLNLVNEHFSGKNNKRLLIWSLLNVDCWMKQQI